MIGGDTSSIASSELLWSSLSLTHVNVLSYVRFFEEFITIVEKKLSVNHEQ